MTVLRNGRHEKFAIGLADGSTQEKAYADAGYSPRSARSSASTLIKQYPNIIQRRDELIAEREMLNTIARVRAMEATQIGEERIMKELMHNAMIAKQAVPVLDKDGNPTGIYKVNISASNQALFMLGKHLGMFHDKPETLRSEHANMSDEELKQHISVKLHKLGLLPLTSELKKVNQK